MPSLSQAITLAPLNPFLPTRTPIFWRNIQKRQNVCPTIASSFHISPRSINQLPATTKEGSPWRPASLPSPRSTRRRETEDAITVVVIACRAILARAVEGFTICGADGQNCDGAILLLHCTVMGWLKFIHHDEVQRRPGDELSSRWREQGNKRRQKSLHSWPFTLFNSTMATLPVTSIDTSPMHDTIGPSP